MDWIITIKEEYIEKILNGNKRYEVRTRIPKELNIDDRILVCKPKTQGKIVAMFEVSCVYRLGRTSAWKLKKWFLGMSEKEYFEYVFPKDIVYLIKIKNAKSIEKPLYVKELGVKKVPQWFAKVKK